MKFKIIKKSFLEALNMVGNAVDAKAIVEVVKCYQLEADGRSLTVTGTDLMIEMRMSLDCEIVEPGAACLPADRLTAFVSALQDGLVEFSCDEKFRATISSGRRTYKLAGLPTKDFPRFKAAGDNPTEVVFPSCGILHGMISCVAYAASTDDTRRALKGVCISVEGQTVRAVATDGRRLSVATRKVEGLSGKIRCQAIVPSKSVRILRTVLGHGGLEEARMTVHGNSIRVVAGRVVFTTSIIGEKYPNFMNAIPGNWKGRFKVDVGELVDEVKSCAVASLLLNKDDKFRRIVMSVGDGDIRLAAATNEIAESRTSIPVKFDGRLESNFNPDYLVDALAGSDCKEVEIRIVGDHNPIGFFSPDGESYVSVLMPLRIR